MWRSLLVLLVLPAGEALAYKPAPPERHDVLSGNRAFVLDVNPSTNRLTVYASGKRDTPLWSFSRRIWQEQHFLSNNGNVVAVVRWRFVQVDDLSDRVCIEFWNRAGKIREYPFAELCPHPARYWFEPGPVGSSWRKWYSEAEADGTKLRVRTTDEFEYEFTLDDGRIVQTTRVGLPWWAPWVLSGFGIGAAVVLVVIWRRRAAGRSPRQHISGV